MARTKAFNPDKALLKARDIFWLKGFEATSMQDLVEGMGLSRSSIYDTFGDKHTLFLRALEAYREAETDALRTLLEAEPNTREAFHKLFDSLVAQAVNDPNRRGCFMANCMVELASLDTAVQQISRENETEVVNLFTAALTRSDISLQHEPEAVAYYLFNAMLGLRVLGKTNPNTAVLQQVADVSLSVLG